MLSIAICDGDRSDIEATAELIRTFISPSDEKNLKLHLFLKPFDFLDSMEKGEFYDIYILETELAGVSGIDTARYLRECGIAKPIIFITGNKTHALEAFEVDALQYLIKPLNRERFSDALDRARATLRNERRRQIVFKTVDGFHHVFYRDILFTETDGKYQVVRINGGEELRVRTTATEMAESLCAQPGYARCGCSYTLNLYHITQYDSKSVKMSDGSVLPVPRGAYSRLNAAYEGYFNSH